MDLLERKRAIMSAFSLSMVLSVGLVKNKEITQHSLEIRQYEATDDECNRHNILMGVRDCASIAHVIYFGLAKQFRSHDTHLHIQFHGGLGLTGTPLFASNKSHTGWELGRQDNIESLAYIHSVGGSLERVLLTLH